MKKIIGSVLGAFVLAQSSAFGAQLVLDSAGMNVGGKVAESQLMTKSVVLNRNEEENAFIVGAILKKGQRVLFELEIEDRSGWNNGDAYYCYVNDSATKKDIGVRATLPLIDISHFGNVPKKTNSSRLTSGTYSWALLANGNDGALGMYQVVCGGHQWGAQTSSVFVRVKKSVFE